jgi:hypothetical protein
MYFQIGQDPGQLEKARGSVFTLKAARSLYLLCMDSENDSSIHPPLFLIFLSSPFTFFIDLI